MSQFTFSGGIHPYDGKKLTKNKPIKDVLPKGDLVYPLLQHSGEPAKAIVKVGDEVKAGQMIAEAVGAASANIFATVSGKVKAIEKHRAPSGDMADSIIVENDGRYEEIDYPAAKPLEQMSREEIIEAVKKAGIVGLGGAGFPTHVKLSPKDPAKIDYVIANCAECEPYLTSDYRRMLENPDLLIGGLKCVLKIFENSKGIIAIEDNKPEAIELLSNLTKDEPRIEVYALRTKYPQGSERHIIYACTRRAINSKMLPEDAGCIVINCDTLIAIHEAVTNNIPLMYRVITVTGDAIIEPGNFKVRCGTSHRELIEEAGGFSEEPEVIISGGPMMGFALFDLDVPVIKTSHALLCMKRDVVSRAVPTACINCGRCVAACPERLIPSHLATYAEFENYEKFQKFFGMECIGCGSCSYVCPAKRQLSQAITAMRRLLMEKAEAGEKSKDEAAELKEEAAKARDEAPEIPAPEPVSAEPEETSESAVPEAAVSEPVSAEPEKATENSAPEATEAEPEEVPEIPAPEQASTEPEKSPEAPAPEPASAEPEKTSETEVPEAAEVEPEGASEAAAPDALAPEPASTEPEKSQEAAAPDAAAPEPASTEPEKASEAAAPDAPAPEPAEAEPEEAISTQTLEARAQALKTAETVQALKAAAVKSSIQLNIDDSSDSEENEVPDFLFRDNPENNSENGKGGDE